MIRPYLMIFTIYRNINLAKWHLDFLADQIIIVLVLVLLLLIFVMKDMAAGVMNRIQSIIPWIVLLLAIGVCFIYLLKSEIPRWKYL